MNKKVWWEDFKRDYSKLCGKEWKKISGILRIIKNNRIRYLFYGRLSCCKNKIIKKIAKNKLQKYSKKYGLEISFENIGAGFLTKIRGSRSEHSQNTDKSVFKGERVSYNREDIRR